MSHEIQMEGEMNRRQFLELSMIAARPGTILQSPEPAADSSGGLLTAGFAERDVTPRIGMEQPGGYGKAYLREFHDPCKVRAAVFDDGRKRVALVSVDALIVPRHVVLAARDGILSRCGVPPEAVMIGASHSHSSGPVGMVQPGEYDHASPVVQRLAYELSSMADPGYLELVQNEIVNAVCQADVARAPSLCSFGAGHEDKAAFNRRFRMRNGRTWTHPGQGNPDILEPAGPIDPTVGVIGCWDAGGNLKGCLVNYACHATTSPDGISANWIYYLETTIRGVMGQGAVVVFLQGFSGDVTQVDNRSPRKYPTGDEYARFVGGSVGAEVVKVLLSATPGASAPVEARHQVLHLDRRTPGAARLKRCLELVQEDPKSVSVTEWIFAKEIVMLDAQLAKARQLEAEIQAIQVGPVLAVSTPGEMFCQLGLDLRAASPFKLTFPVELANGCVGYVPTEEALGPGGGGYETRLTSYSSIEPKGGGKMVEAGVALAKQFTPGRLPEPPKPEPFTPDATGIGSHPWSYGNVPPELS
jgi:hypothetical protein